MTGTEPIFPKLGGIEDQRFHRNRPLLGYVKDFILRTLSDGCLIQLRPETFGAHHARQAAEVTDPLGL